MSGRADSCPVSLQRGGQSFALLPNCQPETDLFRDRYHNLTGGGIRLDMAEMATVEVLGEGFFMIKPEFSPVLKRRTCGTILSEATKSAELQLAFDKPYQIGHEFSRK